MSEQTLNKFSCDSVCSGHIYAKRLVSYDAAEMSLIVRKPVFGVSDQVRHKPSCTIIEDGQRLEISDLES